MERRGKRPKEEKDTHLIQVGKGGRAKAPNEAKKLTRICNGTAAILMMARAANRKSKAARKGKAETSLSSSKQRVAVRITYTTPKNPGSWKAHGTYLQREAAAGHGIGGFTADAENLDIPATLDGWQTAGDKRLFKAIISPEYSEGLDFQQYIRDTMARVEAETGQKLEWVAVVHHNTDHPHAHVAIRGRTRDGAELQLPKEFIKSGFRGQAQDVATNHLGYRTQKQIEEATKAEIQQNRVTNLDRLIDRSASTDATGNKSVDIQSDLFTKTAKEPLYAYAMTRRLATLESMGLAWRISDHEWALPGDYQATLRTLQIAGDRQKMMSRHMEPASSTDQRIVALSWNQVQHLTARVLGHGEDEATGARFMILESLDGTIVNLPHRADTEAMRHRGELGNNQLVTLGRERGRVVAFSHGNADALLKDARALQLIRAEQSPLPNMPGWLGRFHEALSQHEPAPQQHTVATSAMRFSEKQALQLIEAQHPNDPAKQLQALDSLRAGNATLELDNPSVSLRFSQRTSGFYAVVTDDQKAAVQAKLGIKQRPSAQPKTDRERD